MAIRQRGCDTCGSSDRQLLYGQEFVSFDGDIGLLKGYDVAGCLRCGFLYADGLPGPAVFDRYYREMSKHEPGSGDAVQAPYARHNTNLVAERVAEYLPQRAARVLDVGVGAGETLLALRDLGYTDLTGLDPSPRTSAVMQDRHGIRVLNTPVSMLASCEEQFDVILLSGVLEHLRDLRSTLMLLKALLSVNGRMCIAVPDASRFIECIEAPFQYLSVEHISFFTQRSLQSLLAGVGMKPLHCWRSTASLGVFPEPIVHGIFGLSRERLALIPDVTGMPCMTNYVNASRRRRDELMETIVPFVVTGRPLIVWGTGSLTLHLLTDSRFAHLNIVAFVDANPNYWDKTILGIPILPPAGVMHRDQTILIVSYSYQEEIYAEIRGRYRFDNPVVRLFGADQASPVMDWANASNG